MTIILYYLTILYLSLDRQPNQHLFQVSVGNWNCLKIIYNVKYGDHVFEKFPVKLFQYEVERK